MRVPNMQVYQRLFKKLEVFQEQQDINRDGVWEVAGIKADYKREDNLHKGIEAFIKQHMDDGIKLDYPGSSVEAWRLINYLRVTYLGVTCSMELSTLPGWEGLDIEWQYPKGTKPDSPYNLGARAILLRALMKEVEC